MERTFKLALLVLLAALAATCLAIALAPPASAAELDIKLTFKDEYNVRMAQGLNPISFNYSVQHTGTLLSEEVMIVVQNEQLYWQHFLSASTKAGVRTSTNELELMLGRGERANVTLTVTPPQNQLNQTFWMTLNCYPKKAAERNMSHDFAVIIPQFASFEIAIFNEPPEGYFAAIPPSQITVRFALFNTGNGLDRFLIQYESSRSDAGWIMKPEGTAIDEYGWTHNMSADPGKKHPYLLDFKVNIPAEEKADVSCQIIVNATSQFNQTKQMPPAFTSLKSLQYFDFQVYINGLDKKEGSPGQQVEFQLRIWNKGNGVDEFSIKPVWDEDLNKDFIASANPRVAPIGSNDTSLIAYIVKVPETAPKKVYFFTAEVSSSSPDLAIVTKSFELEVGQFFKVALRSPESRMSTYPGGILDFEVYVRNAGNGLDSMTVKLQGTPAKWLTYVQPPEVSLLQNEEAKVSIRIIVPSTFEEAPIGTYNITVISESARSDAVAMFDLEIDIIQFYRIEWMYLDLPITDDNSPIAQPNIIKPRRSVNPYEKNYIDIPLEIKNFGNGDDNIKLWGYAVNPLISVTVSPPETMLKRDDLKLVKVRIEVPQTLPPGIYSLFVNASSQDATKPVKIVPLDFEVFNLDARVPPIPTYVNTDGTDTVQSEIKVTEGTNMSFKLRVENSGTRFINGVLVKIFDNYYDAKTKQDVRWNFFNFTTLPIAVGDKYVVGERPYSAANPPIYWWANISGPHTIEFEITYDFQSLSTNDVSSVNVTVAEKPIPPGIFEGAFAYGIIIAIVIAVIIAIAYVFVLRAKPEVDKDLYSSIYGADFEEAAPPLESYATGEAAEAAPAGPQMTPEQQALYGDDYGGTEGGDAGDEGYDDGEYDEGEEPPAQ